MAESKGLHGTWAWEKLHTRAMAKGFRTEMKNTFFPHTRPPDMQRGSWSKSWKWQAQKNTLSRRLTPLRAELSVAGTRNRDLSKEYETSLGTKELLEVLVCVCLRDFCYELIKNVLIYWLKGLGMSVSLSAKSTSWSLRRPESIASISETAHNHLGFRF